MKLHRIPSYCHYLICVQFPAKRSMALVFFKRGNLPPVLFQLFFILFLSFPRTRWMKIKRKSLHKQTYWKWKYQVQSNGWKMFNGNGVAHIHQTQRKTCTKTNTVAPMLVNKYTYDLCIFTWITKFHHGFYRIYDMNKGEWMQMLAWQTI